MSKISVIVTTYNHEKYIAQALDSILIQENCPDYEIIIGNDYSTDSTAKIIEQYRNLYPEIIKVLKRDSNLGMLNNLKECIQNAKGEYIAILEGDDYWVSKERLAKLSKLLDKNLSASMCFNDIYLLYGANDYTNHYEKIKKEFKEKLTIEQLIEHNNPIANFSCCMYRKKALESIPDGYWQDSNNADWLLNMHILNSGECMFCKERLSVYRIIDSGLFSRLSRYEQYFAIIKACYTYNDIFNKKYEFSFLKAIYNLMDSFKQEFLQVNKKIVE